MRFGIVKLKNFVFYLPLRSPFTIFEVPYNNGTDNNDYVDGQGLLLALSAALGNLQTSLHFARWHDNSAATTLLPKRRRPVLWHWKTTSRIRTHTRSCSSTTIPTTWAAAATSPTWTARWFSTSSMCRSAKCSLKSGTASGIRLISSTRRNSTKRRDCITMVQGTMIRGWAYSLVWIDMLKNIRMQWHITIR